MVIDPTMCCGVLQLTGWQIVSSKRRACPRPGSCRAPITRAIFSEILVDLIASACQEAAELLALPTVQVFAHRVGVGMLKRE